MYVCLCRAITDHEIREAVEEGAVHVAQLAERCGLGTGCGRCQESAQELMDRHRSDTIRYAAA